MKIRLLLTIIFSILLCTNTYATSNQGTGYITDGLYLKVDLINQIPDPIRAGTIAEFIFSIQNNGGAGVDNLIATIDYSYPFSEMSGEDTTKIINKIFSYQSKENAQILKYKLLVDKDTQNGTYEINLRIKRADSEIISIYKFDIIVTGKEYAQIITINKSNINFGVVEDLDFIITNTGNSQLKNIVFSWIDSTETLLPVNSDNTKYIKYLNVGESITVNYKVMANSNSTPGLYKIDLKLDFDNEEYNNTQINTIAGIFIGGKTDFDITFSESDSGIISLSIANIGNNPAYSVNLIIPSQENYTVNGSSSSILGNLDKGDYTIGSFNITEKRTVDFNFTIPDKTNTNIPQPQKTESQNTKLKVTVEYTDSLGERNSITKEIDLKQSSSIEITNTTGAITQFNRRTTTKNTNWYIYIIIGVAIFGSAFYIYRKNQKNKLKRKI